MEDSGLHVLIWLVALSRDVLALALSINVLKSRRLMIVLGLNLLSFSFFTFAYCLVYIEDFLQERIQKSLVGNKSQIVWYFMIYVFAFSVQHSAVTFFCIVKREFFESTTQHLIAWASCAAALGTGCLYILNPASAYLEDYHYIISYVMSLVQFCVGFSFAWLALEK